MSRLGEGAAAAAGQPVGHPADIFMKRVADGRETLLRVKQSIPLRSCQIVRRIGDDALPASGRERAHGAWHMRGRGDENPA